eukprot:3154562-Rhodomonas_salina.1
MRGRTHLRTAPRHSSTASLRCSEGSRGRSNASLQRSEQTRWAFLQTEELSSASVPAVRYLSTGKRVGG